MNNKVCQKNKIKNILYKVNVFTLIDMYFNIVAGIPGKGEHKARIYSRYKFVTYRQVNSPLLWKMRLHVLSQNIQLKPVIPNLHLHVTIPVYICSHARNCDRSINYSEESIIFYTGLPDFITVQDVFEIESLIKHGAEQSCMQSVCEMNM